MIVKSVAAGRDDPQMAKEIATACNIEAYW
jgi:hypothetical protein